MATTESMAIHKATHSDPLPDEPMACLATDELWLPLCGRHGTPWENPYSHQNHNSHDFIQNWRTPILVIHHTDYFRVLETKRIVIFTALQRRGIQGKLLYYTDEKQRVFRPGNLTLCSDTAPGWLDLWLRESSSSDN